MTTPAAFWDKIARKYAKQPIGNEAAYARTLDRVRDLLTPGMTVVELGCGTGTTALILAEAVAGYTGTDVSAEMIAIATEKAAEAGPGAPAFRQGTAADLPADGRLDAVLAFNLLHLLPDLAADLQSIHASLRPGGLFISKSACLGNNILLKIAIGAMQLVGKAPYVDFMTRDALDGQMRQAGFEIVETASHSGKRSSHFVVARKL